MFERSFHLNISDLSGKENGLKTTIVVLNPLSAGDAFKRIHTVFPQLKFDRN